MRNIPFLEFTPEKQVKIDRLRVWIAEGNSSKVISFLNVPENKEFIFSIDQIARTPLLNSIEHGNEELTTWLICQACADLWIQTSTFQRPWITAFIYAEIPQHPEHARVAAIIFHYQNQIPRNLKDPIEKAEYDREMDIYTHFMSTAPEEQKKAFLKKLEELARDASARLSPEILALYISRKAERARLRAGKESVGLIVSTVSVEIDAKSPESFPHKATSSNGHAATSPLRDQSFLRFRRNTGAGYTRVADSAETADTPAGSSPHDPGK